MDLLAEFPPYVLREYALVADGERGALVGPRGDIAWMCAPHWDSDGVFSTLIGGGGVYAVTPTDRFVWGGSYELGTLIWRGRFVTRAGIVEVIDALAMPADPDRAVLLRRIRATDGPAQLRVVLAPSAGFGTNGLQDVQKHDGAWLARTGPLRVRWTGAPDARRRGGCWQGQLSLRAGQQHDLVLELAQGSLPDDVPDAESVFNSTRTAWRRALPDIDSVVARRDVAHACAVLTGMTSARGGTVAAATMSLPERAEQGRNYDYRYAWIRDQCMLGQAAATVDALSLVDLSCDFVAQRLSDDGPRLRPAYKIGGGRVPDEKKLDGLDGYPGGYDRLGNHVTHQFQLDAFGESLLLFTAAARLDRLDTRHWAAVRQAVAAIKQRWREPDAGIWELDKQVWTHSRLACVAGLRAIATHASAKEAATWTALADRILADAARNAVHSSGRWQRSTTDDRVDAALLLAAIRGATPPADSRAAETLNAVRRDLVRDDYVYRFQADDEALGEAEGAFLLCGLMMVLAELEDGRLVQATRHFERVRAACGPSGLFSEEYDVEQRQLRGNLPQAFVHAMFVEAAHKLATATG